MMKQNFILFFTIIILVWIKSDGHAQVDLATIDAMVDSLEHVTDPIRRVDLMNDISIKSNRFSLQRHKEYAEKALKLSQEIGYAKGEVVATKNIGTVKFKEGAPVDTIVKYFRTARNKAHEIGDVLTEIACINNMALTIRLDLRREEAISYFFEALELHEKHLEKSWERALIIANIGVTYSEMGYYDRALDYFEKSRQMANEVNHQGVNIMHIDDLAFVQYKLGKNDLAKETVLNSLDLIKSRGDKESLLQTYIVLSDIYKEDKELENAKYYANEIVKLCEGGDFPLERCRAQLRLTSIAIDQGDWQDAITIGKDAYDCTVIANNYSDRITLVNHLQQAYHESGQYDKAHDMHVLYVSLSEKEAESRNAVMLDELEAKYNNIAIEKELESLKEKERLNRRILRLLTLATAMFALFVLVAGYLIKKRAETNRELVKTNERLKEAKETLDSKNEVLEKYIESNIQLKQFAHIASHDLKSPVRTVGSFITLLKKKAYDRMDKSEQMYMDMIETASKDMYSLVEDLLSYSKVNALDLNIEEVDIKDELDVVFRNMNHQLLETKARVEIEELPESSFRGDRSKLRQVFQNLLSNGMKFVEKDKEPHINIDYIDHNDRLEFVISDNGIGIAPEYREKVFEPFKQLNPKSEYTGTGMGLALINKIIEKHNGNIWIEDSPLGGASFHFTISKAL